MIKVILLFLLFLLMIYSFSQFGKSRIVATFILFCCTIGIVFVIVPTWSTAVANAVGVGRGADLVIYILSVVALAAIFNLHLKLRKMSESQTELARKLAILSAKWPAEIQDK